MKFLIFLVILFVFCKTRNNVISVVLGTEFNDYFLLYSFVNIPHIAARFNYESKKFQINSSAIVTLDSIKSLELFNKRTVLPLKFLM